MTEIKLGARYTFVPSAFIGESGHPIGPAGMRAPTSVTGRITYIHPTHRWFQVTFEVNGTVMKEAIKF